MSLPASGKLNWFENFSHVNLYRCEKKTHIEKKIKLKLILELFHIKKLVYNMD